METHSDTKHICSKCGLALNSSITLGRHIRFVHSDSDVKKYKCKFSGCGKPFKRNSDYKAHLVTHTQLRLFTCTFCETKFSTGQNLRHHKRRTHKAELAAFEASGVVEPPTPMPTIQVLESLIPPSMLSTELNEQ